MKILSVVLLLCTASFGQQDPRYFDTPLGGGGGYAPGWYMPDLVPINLELRNTGFPELSTSGFYTSGGAGFIYVGFIPGLRIGGMGFSGSTSESNEQGLNGEIIYSLGGGGLTIEYSVPFIRNFGVSVGGVVGGGSLSLEIYRSQDSYNWSDVWIVPGNGNNPIIGEQLEVSRTVKNNFWFFSPTLNIEIPVYSRFVVLRIGAGYQLTFGDDWTIYNNKTLTDVPSDVSGNSFFIQSGIFIGFFSF